MLAAFVCILYVLPAFAGALDFAVRLLSCILSMVFALLCIFLLPLGLLAALFGGIAVVVLYAALPYAIIWQIVKKYYTTERAVWEK